MSSLYERIGGKAAVDAAVDLFYNKVLSDARVNHFFDSTPMAEQVKKQKLFLTYAFGGIPNYEGRNMRAAHQGIVDKGMNETHFNIIMEHLGATLTELKVPDALINEAASIAMSVKKDVLCQ